ncbi:MAG: hypothetical protein EG825_10780, partial [Rhodocyclaceae bacterium]|nr:hypothetical protein [Rhodocyclaceae bacterium]
MNQETTRERSMASYKEFHKRSIEQPDAFWSEEAKRIDWH